MVFKSGDKVRINTTGEEGIFQSYAALPEYVLVYIAEVGQMLLHQDEIALESLTTPEYSLSIPEKSLTQEKQIPSKLPDSQGLHILLVADKSTNPLFPDFDLWIYNKSSQILQLNLTLRDAHEILFEDQFSMKDNETKKFCELYYTDLIYQSYLTLSAKTEQGHSVLHDHKVKIQAKKIFVGDVIPDEIPLKSIDLSKFGPKSTPSSIPAKQKFVRNESKAQYARISISDPLVLASFPKFLDLHIEKLHPDPSRLTPQEIYKIQTSAFKKYIEKAIRLGVGEVSLVHGIGQGKLKSNLHQWLSSLDCVAKYENSYDPRFGWGSTRVLFK